MSQVPVQVGPFRPVTVYDAPQVLFTQLLDGELSGSSIARTLTRPNELTPSERSTISERMAKAAGDSRVVKALADVALSPWTWFFFLTSPLGERPVANMFKLVKDYSPYLVDKAPILQHLGLLTSQQAVRGTRMEAVVAQHSRGVEEVFRGEAVQKAALRLGELREALGLSKHGFDWRRYTPGSIEEAKAKEVWASLYGALESTNVDLTRIETARAAKEVRTPGSPWGNRVVTRPAFNTVDPYTILNKHGAGDLPDLIRAAQDEVILKVAKDPETFVKVLQGSKRMGQSGQVIKDILGDVHGSIRKGNATAEEFLKNVQEMILDPIKTGGSTYNPRNVSSLFQNGREVLNEEMDGPWASALRAGGSTMHRTVKTPIVFHEDLEVLKEVLGSTPALEAEIARSKKAYERTLKGETKRFLRINPELSFNRYVKSNAMTYATFVQDVGPEVRRVSAELAAEMRDASGESLIKIRRPNLSAEQRRHRVPLGESRKMAAPLEMDINEAEKLGMAPTGGFSLADILYSDWATVQNPWTRDTISKVIAPRLMGRMSDKGSFLQSVVTSTKEMMGRFLATDAAKSIEQGSAFGKKFIDHMKQVSRPDTAFAVAQELENKAIKTLYSAGMGANFSTALINATQPFILAGNLVGYDHLAKGYGAAFKELGSYIQARAAQGWKSITTAERAELLRKTHKFTNFNGEDLLEIAGDTLANLEGNVLKSISGEHTKHSAASRIFFDIPMALFRNTELLNRNVVAHAAAFRDEAMMAKGLAVSLGEQVSNIRGLVRETQFGSHWMNMAQGFLPEGAKIAGGPPWGKLLSNPLIRQYMTFPARTLGSWAYTVPRMGGRAPAEAWKSWLNDGVRAKAVSAIGVDLAQDLFKADVSRAGFVANITDLVPGFSQGQFDPREGPLPTPPIVDIGYSILKSGFTGDFELLKRTVPRMVPMGAALSRAFKSAPDMGFLGLGQTQYADWGHVVDGKVPVYKDDGTLVEMRNPSELVLRGLGVDMGSFKDESAFMQYLVTQRDQTTEVRRRYMQALVGGDVSGAEAIAAEHQRRWKIPLTVTKGQIRTFMENRERPRVDRQLEKFIEPMRQQYAAESPGPLGLRAQPEYPTFKLGVEQGTTLSPEVIQMIRQEVARRQVPDPRNADQVTNELWGPFANEQR